MLQLKEKNRPSILEFLQTPIIRKRAYIYLKETFERLEKEGGDKDLIEGILYQAKNLGLSLKDKIEELSSRKNKPEFSAEKKRQEKERIKQNL
jgi:hypothetical protein